MVSSVGPEFFINVFVAVSFAAQFRLNLATFFTIALAWINEYKCSELHGPSVLGDKAMLG